MPDKIDKLGFALSIIKLWVLEHWIEYYDKTSIEYKLSYIIGLHNLFFFLIFHVKIILLNYLASDTAEKFIILYSPRFKGYIWFFSKSIYHLFVFLKFKAENIS